MPNVLRFRRKSERYMPDSVEIERFSESTTAEGRQEQAWTTLETTKCRVMPLGGREAEIAGRLAPESNARAFLPFGTDLTVEDRLVVGDRTFEVVHIMEQSDDLSAHVEALISRTG